MNFTTPGNFINSTTPSTWIVNSLEMCILCINLLLALPAHSYVIWFITTGTGSVIASDFFILNLSVCEIVTCLDSLIFVMSNWFLNLIILSQFLQGLTFTGRPLFHCLICVERYLAVVHPVTFLKYKPLRYKAICCTVAWIITLGSCFCCIFIFMLFQSNEHVWFFSLQFLLFFSIELFCLVAILRALKQSGPGERVRDREESHMKTRAFYLVLITTMTMLITYVPYAVIILLSTVIEQNIYLLWLPAVIFYALASFVQPVLYLHRVGKLSCLCSS